MSREYWEIVANNWDYCGQCHDTFVRCGKCGNNCCNGGYGDIDGVECDACESAYAKQERETPPEFSDAYKSQKIAESKEAWRKLGSA